MSEIGEIQGKFDDTPVDGETRKGVTSNWAYDHAADRDTYHQVYVDRGDPDSWDFLLAAFTTDGGAHDLDLSSIVPANAKAVQLLCQAKDDLVASQIVFFKKGYVQEINGLWIRTSVSEVFTFGEGIVAVDENRKLRYRATNTTWSDIVVLVRGWFI